MQKKLLLVAFSLFGLNAVAQPVEKVTFEKGMTIEKQEKPDRPSMGERIADRGDKPSENRAPKPASAPAPAPAPAPAGLKVELSPVSVDGLQKIANIKKAMSQIKGLLAGNFLLGMLQNPIEAAGQGALDIATDSWGGVATAFKNLGTIENKQIKEVITFTRIALDDPSNKPKQGEREFWKKFDEAVQ